MANAVKTLTDVIRQGVKKADTGAMTVMPNYIKLIEREDVSEEELAKNARSYADSLYAESIEKAKSDADKKISDLNLRLDNATRKNERQRADADKSYEEAMEKNADDAIRQGILNSSVYSGMNEKTTEEYRGKIKELEDSLLSTTSTIKREEDVIIKARDVALSNYEIKRAAEYEKKLQKLRAAEYRAREAVRKKNEVLSHFIESYDDNARIAQEEWEDAKRKGQI